MNAIRLHFLLLFLCACSVDVDYRLLCTYLLVFLVQNQGFYLYIEHIDRFHQSKCTWQEFYFLANPMLDNDPKLFCWSTHWAMFPVFLTSDDRNDRQRNKNEQLTKHLKLFEQMIVSILQLVKVNSALWQKRSNAQFLFLFCLIMYGRHVSLLIFCE